MKIQWFGCGQQSKYDSQRFDHFGITNFHKLKFRTTKNQSVSKGETKSTPTLAILSFGDSSRPEPAFASRMVVRDFINEFRHAGRSQILESDSLEKWLRFKIDDLRKEMLNLSLENTQLTGFTASLTAVIVHEKRAIIAQLGKSTLYHLRGDSVHIPSDGDWEGILSNPEIYPIINEAKDGSKIYKSQTVASRKFRSEDLQPLIFSIDLKRKDVLCLTTDGVAQIFPAEKVKNTIKNPRSVGDLEQATQTLTGRANELCADKSIAALTMRIG